MAVKIRMSEEDVVNSIKQTHQFLEMQKKDQRWLHILWIGSFVLIIFLNYTFPNISLVEKKPLYDVNTGFMGLILTVFGFIFFFNAFFFKSIKKESILFTIICIILLYYGLPLFLGFKW